MYYTMGLSKLNYRAIKKNNNLLNIQSAITTSYHQLKFQHAQQAASETYSEHDRHAVKPFSDMPGPKKVPLIGTLWQLIGPMKKKGYTFHQLFKMFNDNSQIYGPVYKEKLGAKNVVIVSDLDECSKLAQVDSKTKYPYRREIEPVKDYQIKKNLGLGVLNSQQEEWHHHRSLLNKKLLRPGEIQNFAVQMSFVADDLAKEIKNKCDKTTGYVPELEQTLFRWSLESLGVFVFGERLGCFEETMPPMMQEFVVCMMRIFKYMNSLMFNPLYKFIPTNDWRQFETVYDRASYIGKKLIEKKIERKIQQVNHGTKTTETNDFLSYLLVEKKLTPNEALSYTWDIWSGGLETTSFSTLWLLYALSKNSSVQENLYKEISSIVSDHVEITADMLTQLPYVKACFKEQQRLFPLSPGASRVLQTDVKLGGYMVPMGTDVLPNIFGMGRDARLYKDPLEFRPERWLRTEKTAENENRTMTVPSLTFGHGPRMCIGRRIAEQEVHLVISKVIQYFKLEYVGSEDVQPEQNLVIVPDRPVKIRFIPRKRQ